MTTTAAVRFFNFPIQNSSKIAVLPTNVTLTFLIQRKVVLKHNQVFMDNPTVIGKTAKSREKLTLAILRKRAFFEARMVQLHSIR